MKSVLVAYHINVQAVLTISAKIGGNNDDFHTK